MKGWNWEEWDIGREMEDCGSGLGKDRKRQPAGLENEWKSSQSGQGFIYLVDFLKEPAPHFVDSLYGSLCFFLVDFSPEFISHLLLLLGIFASFYSRAFRCAVKLLVYALSSFFLEALRAMSFPMSHKFGYVVPSFSLNSKVFNLFLYFFLDQVTIEYSAVQLPCVCGLSVVFIVIEDQPQSVVI